MTESRVVANWLTRKISPQVFLLTSVMVMILFGLCFYSWKVFDLSASRYQVFTEGQYWRLWSSLFSHSDLGHILGNAFLFVPLAFVLMGYFNLWLFPAAGIFIGGVISGLVLTTMPEMARLSGISGVVNWMGAVWLTLFVLIDTRKTLRRRFAIALFVTLMLFAPETFKEDISYTSHFIGFIFGVISAGIYYAKNKEKFKAAEVVEVDEEPVI
jgi:rhomboid protease GluP